MREFFPILFAFAIAAVFATAFIIAYALMKDKKTAVGFDRNMKDVEIIRRLAHYARPYIKTFVAIILIMLVTVAYSVLSPYIVGRIEDLIKGDFEMRQLYKMVIAYCCLLVASLTAMYFEAIMLQRTSQKVVASLREDLFNHIEHLSHAQLNKIPVGKLVTRTANDTESILRMFTDALVNLIKNCFVIVGVLVAMFMLNVELTLMVLCFVPFIVTFTIIFRKFSRAAYRKSKDAMTDMNTFLSENLSGMKIIQIFNREGRKNNEFGEKNHKLDKCLKREFFVFCVFRPIIYMLYISSVLCLLYLGGKGYIENTSFLGQIIDSSIIVSFYMYINKFFDPVQSLAEQFNRLQSAFASAEKVFTILDMIPEVQDEPDAVDVDEIHGEIEFKDVWFYYVPEEWVLKGVSFKIDAGDTVAFVGSTGSGKSTILSLICRNYDIQKGQILIDGRDIRCFTIASLRHHFGQMLQDVFLFAGTVRSNILLESDGVSDDEINEACRYVNADHFISQLEHGLDEQIYDRGNNLSAGQRQLLSFARTVLHKPSVLILDEATANIDTETEIVIQNSLEKLMNLGTMLIVAHRLSTVRNADKIIVLSHGVIKEQGNHEKLMAQKGRYHALYMMQARKQELEMQ